MVSGSISLPSPGFFSPFPHGTSSLSVAVEYLALDRGRPGFRRGFTCPALLRYRTMETHQFQLRGCHPLWLCCPAHSLTDEFYNSTGHPRAALQPHRWFGLLPVRSPLLRESLLISVPGLLRWFTSSGVAPAHYFIHASRVQESLPAGYPIRLSADQRICAPPRSFSQLVTAFFALRPHRHPPWTYLSLDHIILPVFVLFSTNPSLSWIFLSFPCHFKYL